MPASAIMPTICPRSSIAAIQTSSFAKTSSDDERLVSSSGECSLAAERQRARPCEAMLKTVRDLGGFFRLGAANFDGRPRGGPSVCQSLSELDRGRASRFATSRSLKPGAGTSAGARRAFKASAPYDGCNRIASDAARL